MNDRTKYMIECGLVAAFAVIIGAGGISMASMGAEHLGGLARLACIIIGGGVAAGAGVIAVMIVAMAARGRENERQ